MVHNIKILPQYFDDIYFGFKTFEYRNNDRNYSVGDIVYLNEFFCGSFTGRVIRVRITYVLTDFIPNNYCVFSFVFV